MKNTPAASTSGSTRRMRKSAPALSAGLMFVMALGMLVVPFLSSERDEVLVSCGIAIGSGLGILFVGLPYVVLDFRQWLHDERAKGRHSHKSATRTGLGDELALVIDHGTAKNPGKG